MKQNSIKEKLIEAYRNIREGYNMDYDIPYKQIDNYLFFPICKYCGTRFIIALYSFNYNSDINITYKSKKTIWFYTSKSQGNVWRYCYSKKDSSGYFEKGLDYTSTTLVNFRLQKFIWEIFDKLPETNDKWQVGSNICNDSEGFKNVDNKNRHCDDDVFKPLQNLDPEESIRDVKYIKDYISYHSKLGIKKNEIYLIEFTKILNEKLQNDVTMKEIINRNHAIFKDTIYAYKFIKKVMNKYMESMFRIKKEPIELYKRDFTLGSCNITGTYHTIQIQQNVDKTLYNIYYMNYNYKHHYNVEYNGHYNIPLLVTSDNSKINAYGLYDSIVRTGFYVYKPFEYIDQIISFKNYESINRTTAKSYENRKINEHYIFIGDLVTDNFPLK